VEFDADRASGRSGSRSYRGAWARGAALPNGTRWMAPSPTETPGFAS
jgi:hypothetical protein